MRHRFSDTGDSSQQHHRYHGEPSPVTLALPSLLARMVVCPFIYIDAFWGKKSGIFENFFEKFFSVLLTFDFVIKPAKNFSCNFPEKC